MTWFAVWQTASGDLVSVGTVVASPLPAGLSTTDLGANPPSGVWNKVTHVFEASTLKASLPFKLFLQRFTQTESEALQNLLATGTQAQKNKLNAFIEYCKADSAVDLNDAYVVASVNLMESAGIIGAGRATVILG